MRGNQTKAGLADKNPGADKPLRGAMFGGDHL